MKTPRLTRRVKDAIAAALDAALAGEGFDGGDFEGMDRQDFEDARGWIYHKMEGTRGSTEPEPIFLDEDPCPPMIPN